MPMVICRILFFSFAIFPQAVSQRKALGKDAEQNLHIKLVAEIRRQIREVRRNGDAVANRVSRLEEKKENLTSEIQGLSQSISRMVDKQEQLR